jgi:hypothetical protein
VKSRYISFSFEEKARVLRTLTAVIAKLGELRTRLLEHYNIITVKSRYISFSFEEKARVLRTLPAVIAKVEELRTRLL